MGIWDRILGLQRKRVGLALGAGGARGLAHVGVIKALQERGYKIEAVSGSSMGAIIAAMFAFNPDWESVYSTLRNYLEQNRDKLSSFDVFRDEARHNGMEPRAIKSLKASLYRLRMYRRFIGDNHILSDDILWEFVNAVIPDERIENASVPLAIVTYDIVLQQEVVFTAGPVRPVVVASSSIPAIFPPQDVNGMLLVDGGAISPVPVACLKDIGVKNIIAVDVSPPDSKAQKFDNAIDVIFGVLNGALEKIKKMELADAKAVVSPEIVGIQWWRFEYFDSIIKKGYIKTREMLERGMIP